MPMKNGECDAMMNWQNGSWTTGDYLTDRQPEYVVYFSKTLQVREKWEIEEQWSVSRDGGSLIIYILFHKLV